MPSRDYVTQRVVSYTNADQEKFFNTLQNTKSRNPSITMRLRPESQPTSNQFYCAEILKFLIHPHEENKFKQI